MPDTKPATLPDQPPDPSLFGVPTNERPEIRWPDPVPRDGGRDVQVSEGATHVVIADHFGGSPGWERGDKIKEEDLPEGGHTLEELMRMKPYPPIRPLRDDERPRPEEVTKHDRKPKAAAGTTSLSDLGMALMEKEKTLTAREKALAEREAKSSAVKEPEPLLPVKPSAVKEPEAPKK